MTIEPLMAEHLDKLVEFVVTVVAGTGFVLAMLRRRGKQ